MNTKLSQFDFPHVHQPVPVSACTRPIANERLDMSLCFTPEKYSLSFAPNHNSDDDDESSHIEHQSRVRFAPEIAVHQLSPDYSLVASSNSSSPKYLSSFESSLELEGVSPADNFNSCTFPFLISSYDKIEESYPLLRLGALKSKNDWTRHSVSNYEMEQNSKLFVKDAAALCSGDLKNLYPDRIHVPEQNAEHTVPAVSPCHTTLSSMNMLTSEPIISLPFRVDCIGDKGRTIQSRSYSATNDSHTKKISATPLAAGAAENLLVQPEMNSTLRIRNDIDKLREHEFDIPNVMQHKVDSNTKLKIDERAQCKLNAQSPQFSDLVGLEVCKEEMLFRLTEEKLARVRLETDHRLKPEEFHVQVPDIMDLFTTDLQKDAICHSLAGITLWNTPARIVEPARAFDVYRRVRQWEK